MTGEAGSVAVRVAGAATAATGGRPQPAEVRLLATGAWAGRHGHEALHPSGSAFGTGDRGSVADQELEIGAASRTVVVVDGHAMEDTPAPET